jgi:RNA polymerase sigma-70 factor, ECF subfamily
VPSILVCRPASTPMSQQPEPIHASTAPSERFVTQLTAAQGALYAYVCALLGGSRDAADVLQETNLVLWRKADQFNAALSFNAWAYKIAFLQVMAHRKKQATDRHQFTLSEDSLAKIAARMEPYSETFAQRMRLLDECIAKLSHYQRELIRLRYIERLGVNSISSSLQKSENSVAAALYRARRALIDCVETKPGAADSP